MVSFQKLDGTKGFTRTMFMQQVAVDAQLVAPVQPIPTSMARRSPGTDASSSGGRSIAYMEVSELGARITTLTYRLDNKATLRCSARGAKCLSPLCKPSE